MFWTYWFGILNVTVIFVIEILVLLKSSYNFCFHWSSSSVWWGCVTAFIWLNLMVSGWNLCIENLLLSVRSVGKEWWANEISQHLLAVEFNFEWLPLINNSINSSAQILWFKMCSSFGALVLLTCIVIGIDSFVIVEINIFSIIIIICLLLLSLFFIVIILYLVLIVLVVWKLIDIIFVLHVSMLLVVLTVLTCWHLFSMDSSVLLNFHLFL